MALDLQDDSSSGKVHPKRGPQSFLDPVTAELGPTSSVSTGKWESLDCGPRDTSPLGRPTSGALKPCLLSQAILITLGKNLGFPFALCTQRRMATHGHRQVWSPQGTRLSEGPGHRHHVTVSIPSANTPQCCWKPEERLPFLKEGALKGASGGFRQAMGLAMLVYWSACWPEPGSAYEMVSSSVLT